MARRRPTSTARRRISNNDSVGFARVAGVAALAAILLAVAISALPSTPPVKTRLRTSWAAPHLVLEALEYVAQENASAYFPLLEVASSASASASLPSDPDELYDKVFDMVDQNGFLSSFAALQLYKSSLSLHTHAPAVQAYYHLYDTTVVPALNKSRSGFDASCAVWVEWQQRQYCSFDAFKKAASGTKSKVVVPVYSFDHAIYPRNVVEAEAPVAVVYADIFAPTFASFHGSMVDAVNELGVAYVLRYRTPVNGTGEPLFLSGYGVELWIKKTDYKVIDDRKVVFPGGDSDAELEGEDEDDEEFKEAIEADEKPVIMKLEEAQVKDLGNKAADYILTSPNPLRSLAHLTQNFPRLAHQLVDRQVPDELAREISVTQQTTRVQPGFSGLWINGLDVGTDSVNLFQLLRFLRVEGRVVDSVMELGLDAKSAVEILNTRTTEAKSLPWGDTFDVRDEMAIIWLNDLEKDRRYQMWPRSIRELLRPGFPNQFKFVRKNAYTLIALLDLSNVDHVDMLMTLFTWISREIPLRFGVVLLSDAKSAESRKIAELSKSLVDFYGLKYFRDYIMKLREAIGDEGTTFPADLVDQLSAKFFEETKATAQLKAGIEGAPLNLAVALEGSQSYLDIANAHAAKFGISKTEGAWFLNGRLGDIDDGWQEEVVQAYFAMLEYLQRKVYYAEINDETNVFDHFSTIPGVLPRRNPYIGSPTPSRPAKFVDLGTLDSNVPYVSNVKEEGGFAGVTMWLAADFTSPAAIDLLANALRHVEQEGRANTRIALIQVGNAAAANPIMAIFNAAAEKSASGVDVVPALAAFTTDLAAESTPVGEGQIKGNLEKLSAVLSEDQVADLFKPIPESTNGKVLASSFNVQAGEALIVVNGRVFGPFPVEQTKMTKDDFDLASMTAYQGGVLDLQDVIKGQLQDSDANEKSDALLRLQSIMGKEESAKELEGGFQAAAKTRQGVVPVQVDGTVAQFAVGDAENAVFRVYAVVDPASTQTQRLSAIFEFLASLDDLVHITVRLNPMQGHKDVPIKRFYRFVTQKTHDAHSAVASFKRLPEDTLLSLDIDVPNAWLAMPVSSVHDLDNIKLADLTPAERAKGIDSVFELTKVLVEGHCLDSKTRQPPRGLQFVLGSSSYPDMVDTIVMANLGYFQLKAGPGVWQLRLRAGRSSRIYDLDIVSEDAREFSKSSGGMPFPVASVSVRSFEGLTLFVKVSKKPGKEAINLLDEDGAAAGADDEENESGGIWSSIKKGLGLGGDGSKEAKSNETTINVFSVASGHLYERFMSIMFIGVMRHTKSPVKFWLIENFMSPTFKDFLPNLAKEYGFQYELVTYKWPHWLRAQTEKQRTIWGYKILFLDVLFPLSLDRVIFVDADQIVRTDLKELMEMDIGGAPYAYTPFCDSRTETEGYRFWKSGYWSNHLGGRPYHISALYLVDLARFRAMAAGDRLRGQYQMLSADPESLANLDQDLPNNLIHQVPIFSLPQEWLWCETWCDDESLKTAKTIDLCNNPMTKEPKLDRAKRQIPEWSVYDNEVSALAAKVAAQKPNTSKPSRDEL